MTADLSRRLSSMDFLDEDEHVQLYAWGNRAVLNEPVTVSASIPRLFAVQVARAPEAVAVVFDGRSMTYAELDEASNRLAQTLIGRGVGPGKRVALLFPRSIEAIVSIVAVGKAGARSEIGPSSRIKRLTMPRAGRPVNRLVRAVGRSGDRSALR